MKNVLKSFALLYLVLLLGFFAGIYVTISKSWPYSEIRNFYLFVQGDPTEDTTIAQKVQNDLGLHPARHLLKYNSGRDSKLGPLAVPGLRERREEPLIYHSAGAERGYRLIHGVLDFEQSLHGAMLLDASGKHVHTWITTEQHLDWPTASELNKFPHGIVALPDGSLVFVFTRSSSIQRINACSEPVWAQRGKYSHAVTTVGKEFVWTLLGTDKGESDFLNGFVKLNVNTGELVKSFTMEDIILANPELPVFHVQNMRKDARLLADGFHLNDADPLPVELAAAFPGFQAGDLLISLRNISLVFVLDPETLEVKWWRTGFWRWQHDPDWQPDGTISLYNNNPPDSNFPVEKGKSYFSTIERIDPVTYQQDTMVAGADFDFYSFIRGKHQVLPGGNILITSTNQGRALEVNRDGEVVFEFVNRYSNDEVLPVSEVIFLPEDFFEEGVFSACESRE